MSNKIEKIIDINLKENKRVPDTPLFKIPLDQLTDAAFITAMEGKILAVNQKVEELINLKIKELIGLNLLELGFFSKEGMTAITENFSKLISGIPVVPYEAKIYSDDNKEKIVNIDLKKIEYNGKSAALIELKDISDFRKLEEELFEIDYKQKILFEGALNPIMIINEDGRYIDANKAALDFFECDKKDLIGEIADLPPDIMKIQASKQLPFISRRTIKVDYIIQGRSKRLLINIVPLIISNKTFLYSIGQDITERELLEKEFKSYSEILEQLIDEHSKELLESEERYRRLVEYSPDAIFVLRKGRIIFANPATAKILGYLNPEELIGKSITSMIHPEYQNMIKEKMMLVESGDHLPLSEIRFISVYGKEIDVEIIAIPISYQNEQSVHTIFRDITKKKQTENELRKIKEKRDRAEMMEKFISDATHELRTPLVSIKGFVDRVIEGKSGKLPKQAVLELEIVKRNTERLLNLVDELLDIRRIESGKLRLNLKPIDFQEVIQHCVNEIKPLIEGKKQRFNFKVPRGNLVVKGDIIRLSQALMNLLNNASKFTPEKGKIELSVEKMKKSIQVQIKDTGIGIKNEDIDRIFEPFVDIIKKSGYIKGTGLGLSVTKGLINGHGGKIWAESSGKGKGATFTFTLPKLQNIESH
ncbi:MAG: PAS domain S-box protein [Candidatus Bathyarchaeota archaeon]|nr:PAS domain S-box protein [Candidatus Bathyarchaeota archaeon]